MYLGGMLQSPWYPLHKKLSGLQRWYGYDVVVLWSICSYADAGHSCIYSTWILQL